MYKRKFEGIAIVLRGGFPVFVFAGEIAELEIAIGRGTGRPFEPASGSLAIVQAQKNLAAAQLEPIISEAEPRLCLLYTSYAADRPSCVDLGGRRTVKTKKQ